MGIFKKRQNKKFDYTPRYYNKEGKGSPFDIKHKFDEHRTSTKPPSGLKAKFSSAFNELKTPQEKIVSKRILIIIIILVLIVLYIIDFDLSIFLK